MWGKSLVEYGNRLWKTVTHGLPADRTRAKGGRRRGARAQGEELFLNLQSSPTVAPWTPSLDSGPCHLQAEPDPRPLGISRRSPAREQIGLFHASLPGLGFSDPRCFMKVRQQVMAGAGSRQLSFLLGLLWLRVFSQFSFWQGSECGWREVRRKVCLCLSIETEDNFTNCCIY